MIKIQTITCASNTSSIDFTSIPATYTDLRVVIHGRSWDSNGNISLYVNGNASVPCMWIQGNGSGSSASYANTYAGFIPISTTAANTFGSFEFYMPNYLGTTYVKNFVCNSVTEDNSSTAYSTTTAGMWNSTAAVNQLTFNGDFATNSTATLYGILAGAGGSTVTTA